MVGPGLSRERANNMATFSVKPRDPPVSASPVMGLQIHATMPDIFMWALGIQRRPLCIQDRHLTELASQPPSRLP